LARFWRLLIEFGETTPTPIAVYDRKGVDGPHGAGRPL
jgi:hypothetical protein